MREVTRVSPSKRTEIRCVERREFQGRAETELPSVAPGFGFWSVNAGEGGGGMSSWDLINCDADFGGLEGGFGSSHIDAFLFFFNLSRSG